MSPWSLFRVCAILPASRASFARLVVTAAIACAAAAGFAQSDAVAPPPQSPQTIARALKAGGYIVYFRHTATDFSQNDQQMRDFDDCRNQRNLTDSGRDQARKIGEAWRRLGIPVGRVLASPYCRTREVAELAFGRYERAQDVRGGPGTAEDGGRYQPLSELLAAAPKPGTNNVISSHGNPFRALHPEMAYLQEGEAAVIRPLPGGAHQVVARVPWDQWPAP